MLQHLPKEKLYGSPYYSQLCGAIEKKEMREHSLIKAQGIVALKRELEDYGLHGGLRKKIICENFN